MGKVKVGDRVRIVRIPQSVLDMPARTRDGEEGTLTVFGKLMLSKRSYRVTEIHETLGWPWIEFRERTPEGKTLYHSVLLDAGCYEVVPRSRDSG